MKRQSFPQEFASTDIAPADRLSSVEEYWFSKKIAEVAAMRARGLDVLSVAIGGPDLPPHPDVVECLACEAENPHNHSYQNTRSIPELRDAFSRWYSRKYGVELNADTEILPLIGSKEGIMHISLAFLNPGDKVLVPNPGYPTYTSVTRLVGATPVYYNLAAENGWQPDFPQLDSLVSAGDVKLIWVNYPNMPTGAPARRETFERLVDFGRRHRIVVAHDNPYSFILNPQPMSILQVPGAKDICIELNSMSKSHNMAGWRVAMLASNPLFTQWVLKVKSNVDSGQFRPLMLAAVKALDLGDDWTQSLNEEYRRRRSVAEQIMESLRCSFDPSQSGLFLWGRIPEDYPSGEWLAERLLVEQHLFLTPGFIFGSQGDRYIRLSLCANVDTLKRALARARAFTNSLKHERP